MLIGLPTLRLRGDYIAIVTLAFGEIIGRIAINGDEIKFASIPLLGGPLGNASATSRHHRGKAGHHAGGQDRPSRSSDPFTSLDLSRGTGPRSRWSRSCCS